MAFWTKINVDIQDQLIERSKDAAEAGKYIEAVAIQFAGIEGLVRVFIQLKLKSNSRFSRYWNGDGVFFSNLIDYYELAGGEEKMVQRLRAYNDGRNDVIHRLNMHKSIEDLDQRSKETFDLGKEIITGSQEIIFAFIKESEVF